MKGDCKGKCQSAKFRHEHKARDTRKPVYDHDREWYCWKCELAYPGRLLDCCPCCGRVLRKKPRNGPVTLAVRPPLN